MVNVLNGRGKYIFYLLSVIRIGLKAIPPDMPYFLFYKFFNPFYLRRLGETVRLFRVEFSG